MVDTKDSVVSKSKVTIFCAGQRSPKKAHKNQVVNPFGHSKTRTKKQLKHEKKNTKCSPQGRDHPQGRTLGEHLAITCSQFLFFSEAQSHKSSQLTFFMGTSHTVSAFSDKDLSWAHLLVFLFSEHFRIFKKRFFVKKQQKIALKNQPRIFVEYSSLIFFANFSALFFSA